MKQFWMLMVFVGSGLVSNLNAQEEVQEMVERMPTTVECEGIESEQERNNCTSQAIAQHLVDNLKYPRKARKSDSSGLVVLQFTVTKTGDITDIEVLKSPDPIFNEPAIEALESLPQMIPGQQKGKNVPVRYALPIRFSLNG